MLTRGRGAPGEKPLVDSLKHIPPIVGAGKIDMKALKLGNARGPPFLLDLAVVADCHQRRRLRAGLVDVAPLRIARHHDRRPAPLLEPLMNVAERPIVEACAMEIPKPAGRVEAVSGRAVDARVQRADIDA